MVRHVAVGMDVAGAANCCQGRMGGEALEKKAWRMPAVACVGGRGWGGLLVKGCRARWCGVQGRGCGCWGGVVAGCASRGSGDGGRGGVGGAEEGELLSPFPLCA
eukprot:1159166-Pelagomonas_calceolata.AAC.5